MSFVRPIHVSDAARRQITEADRWWRAQRLKAPNAVLEELEKFGRLIAAQPHIGKRAVDVTLAGVRRLHLERIHYDVYYRVIGDPEVVEIVAFWSSRRGSDPPV